MKVDDLLVRKWHLDGASGPSWLKMHIRRDIVETAGVSTAKWVDWASLGELCLKRKKKR